MFIILLKITFGPNFDVLWVNVCQMLILNILIPLAHLWHKHADWAILVSSSMICGRVEETKMTKNETFWQTVYSPTPPTSSDQN